MGNHNAKPTNKSMVDRLVENNSYIRTASVEGAFRAVDRGMYFDLEEGEEVDPYDEDPWRRGNLHLSAPCIYANVVEALDLRPGLSFLNLGSGTGYLNTIIGLLIGPSGINHGVEFHADVVEFAYKRLRKFIQESYAIDKYDFSEPIFIKGNCLNLNPNSKYDRIYLGAACLPNVETFVKKLIKPDGGILVMPIENRLMRYTRLGESEWKSEKLMSVNFTSMIRQEDNEIIIDMPLAQAKSLKELCRIMIRQRLREKTDSANPHLLHSDNIKSRRMRRAKAEEKFDKRRLRAERLRSFGQPWKRRGECVCVCECETNRNTQNNDTVGLQEHQHADISSSNRENRVVTRSTSRRRLENQDVGSSGISEDKHSSSLNNHQNDGWTSDDSPDNNRSTRGRSRANRHSRLAGQCARTRPILVSPSKKTNESLLGAAFSAISSRSTTRGNPIRRPSSSSRLGQPLASQHIVSSPSSSSLSSLDSYNEEIDFMGRHFVVNLPNLVNLSTSSDTGDLDSQYVNSDDDSSSGESSLDDFFDNLEDEIISDNSELDNDRKYSDSQLQNNSIFRHLRSARPQPGTSRNPSFGSRFGGGAESLQTERDHASDQEPVARRLRSKRAPIEPNQKSSDSNDKSPNRKEALMPGCSRDEATHEPCPHHRRCPAHPSNSKHANLRYHGRGGSVCARSSVPASSSSIIETNDGHSAGDRYHDRSESSGAPEIGVSPGQSMFSGRVLITAGIGTAPSVAICHYMPDRRHNSLRLLEHLAQIGPTRPPSHLRMQQNGRKRKWNSSSDSSETSNDNSPPSRRWSCGRRHLSRRRCGCPRSSSSVKTSDHEIGIKPTTTTSSSFSTPRAPSAAAQSSSLSLQRANSMQVSSASSSASNSSTALSSLLKAADDEKKKSEILDLFKRRWRNSLTDSRVDDNSQVGSCSSAGLEVEESGAGGVSDEARNQVHHCRHGHHHHCHHRHHSRRHHHINTSNSNQGAASNSMTSSCLKEDRCCTRAERKQRQRERRQMGENECERYHNHLSGYIRQLPLPLVLHSYLNYDRNSS